MIVFPHTVSAAVVINEIYSPASDDWIELYNTATESADLSMYYLADATGNTKDATNNKQGITSLAPSAMVVVAFSNWLNNAGDTVKLQKRNSDIPVDQISYGTSGGLCAPGTGQSIGSQSDGSGTIVRFAQVSEGYSNNSSPLAPCPTAPPIPSNTLAPSSTPQPTLTPQPSVTSIPTSTVTPKKTPTSTPKITPTPSDMDEDYTDDMVETDEEPLVLAAVDEATPSSVRRPLTPTAISLLFVGGGSATLTGALTVQAIVRKRNSMGAS